MLKNSWLRRWCCGVAGVAGRRARVALAAATLFVASAPVLGSVDCTGTITSLSVYLDANGIVILSLSGGPNYTYLCATNADYNNVAAQVCRTMYATLVAAKLAGKRVLIRFDDYSACTSVPSLAAAGQLGWNELLLD
jgi:hypothetical protein